MRVDDISDSNNTPLDDELIEDLDDFSNLDSLDLDKFGANKGDEESEEDDSSDEDSE